MKNHHARPQKNAVSVLKDDHQTVKALFDRFERTKNAKMKKMIVDKAINELKIHATIEEEIFYPAVRQSINDKEGIMEEADEEHHVAKVLIAELEQMKGDEDHYDAKFTVLAENVRHHIKEEELDMFPKATKAKLDLKTLGEELLQRKRELAADGVPQDAESKMVQQAGLRDDSPAAKAEAAMA